jgi:hypothetical protein
VIDGPSAIRRRPIARLTDIATGMRRFDVESAQS